MIQLGGKTFELAYENKNGWNFEAFRDRYSDVLDRYDYIVGDWGYNQLRLKGFFREGNPKGSKESSITSLQEYIQEYCNFGCAYFVLERIPNKKKPQDSGEPHDSHKDGQRKQHHQKHKEQPKEQQQQPAQAGRHAEAKESKEHKKDQQEQRRRHHQRGGDQQRQERSKANRSSKNA